MSIDVTLFYVIPAFLIAYAILKRYLFVPLAGILEERETEERNAARVHAESLQNLAAAVERAEKTLAEARRDALKERETLRSEGRSHLEKKLAEAHAAATELLQAASRDISTQAARSSAELPSKVVSLARALAEKVLGRKLAA